MGFGYNLGRGKGMDPKVNAQRGRGERLLAKAHRGEEARIQNWAVVKKEKSGFPGLSSPLEPHCHSLLRPHTDPVAPHLWVRPATADTLGRETPKGRVKVKDSEHPLGGTGKEEHTAGLRLGVSRSARDRSRQALRVGASEGGERCAGVRGSRELEG